MNENEVRGAEIGEVLSNTELCSVLDGFLQRAGEAMVQLAATPMTLELEEDSQPLSQPSADSSPYTGEPGAEAVTVEVTAAELESIGLAADRCRALELLDLLARGRNQAAEESVAKASSDAELAELAAKPMRFDGTALGIEGGCIYSGEAAEKLRERLRERQAQEQIEAETAQRFSSLAELAGQSRPFRPV